MSDVGKFCRGRQRRTEKERQTSRFLNGDPLGHNIIETVVVNVEMSAYLYTVIAYQIETRLDLVKRVTYYTSLIYQNIYTYLVRG